MLSTALRFPTLRPFALRFPKLEPRQVSASMVLAVALVLNVFAGLSLVGIGTPAERAVAKVANDLPAALRNQAPPAPEPMQFRDLDPQDALAVNASIPLSDLPNPAARPFKLNAATPEDRTRAIECLASAVYYEAASEGADGERAVAQVVLNRVRHPAFPNSVCGVVYQGSERATGCQFTFTCDGSLARVPVPSLWQQARKIAEAAIDGAVFKPVGWSTHYHTNWVVPYWQSSLVKAANVGSHIFYRWTGGWGTGPAFRTRYAGVEPVISKMAHLSTVPAEGTDELAAALADAAAAAPTTGADPAALPLPADLAGRAVIRRYEPASAEGVASLVAAQAKSGAPVSSSHMWAMTGAATAGTETPLGQKKSEAPAAKPETAKPEQPRELEGVRKVAKPYGPSATE